MHRSVWDLEQHARHTERQAMAEAERARLFAAARPGGRHRRGLDLVAWLRAGGDRVETWVAGTPRRPAAVPAPCREWTA